MNLEYFLKAEAPSWMGADGSDHDIVISTRIRLARNLEGFRFPLIFTDEEAKTVDRMVTQAFYQLNDENHNFSHFAIQEMPALQRQVLVEKHLISPMLAQSDKYASVIISQDESISAMVNEEDHLRIQCLAPGLKLMETYEVANKLDSRLEKLLPFAFHNEFGYLTSCPTNVGTGLRASVMMHLPGLSMMKQMKSLTQMLARFGMVVRGIYGEGSENLGNMYQISNQITLGKSEDEIIEDLQNVVMQIIEQERKARHTLLSQSKIALEDRIYRAYGTLKHARIMTSEEAATCLSNVRLGVDLGIIKDVSKHILNECTILIQPGFVQQYAGTTLEPAERDVFRAKLIREKLNSENLK
ncbi:protein arginine kinase [Ureibacillus sp. FSL K6-8385]|uniref:Protein-arginine kinase n=1 Tax=Ureibacillus terrenus TaxID=118246 RepID=A0A540V2S0_9BACL|nr:protein arginine kinase [Ureibacillus terrenus]MED3661676.1 protein arginine kinase [Ureibacillus terrenus]MED3763542.1 protein arginine kinase [Ureibacillus terrenus]TQE91031.1 protein arginine kinase [Ureibacillus terrenus]